MPKQSPIRTRAEVLVAERFPAEVIAADLAERYPRSHPLERARLARGIWTPEGLEDRCRQAGQTVSAKTIRRIEQGRAYSQRTLQALRSVLGVEADQLLDGGPGPAAPAGDGHGLGGDELVLPAGRGASPVRGADRLVHPRETQDVPTRLTPGGWDDDVLAMWQALTSGCGEAELARWEVVIDHALGRSDTLETGTATLPWWRQEYRRIERVLRQPQPAGIRRRLARLAALAGGQLNRLAWAEGDPQRAELVVQTALVAAEDAAVGEQDPERESLAVWLLANHAAGVASQLAWTDAARLAGQGRERADEKDRAALAMLWATSAKAKAGQGDRGGAQRAMRQAERAYERAIEGPWVSPLVTSQRLLTFFMAHVFMASGDQVNARRYSQRWQQQYAQHAGGVMGVMVGLDAATMDIRDGEVEHGCHLIRQALEQTPTRQSRWPLVRARQVITSDLADYRELAPVQDLREALAAAAHPTRRRPAEQERPA